MNEERIRDILRWAMHNRAEDVEDFSKVAKFYYWTPEGKKILNKLLIFKRLLKTDGYMDIIKGDSLLIGVIGKSGVGKSALLHALDFEVYGFFKKRLEDMNMGMDESISIIMEFKRHNTCEELDRNYRVYSNTIFIDTPDYGTRDIRKINSDLTELNDIWRRFRPQRATNLVIFLQKELVEKTDHFFLRKMDIVELKPLIPEQLVEAFKTRFATCEPFTDAALKSIADLSRGVFRRFMRYVHLCVENVIEKKREEITIEDVKDVITSEILLRDLDLELSDVFRNERYKRCAVDVLKLLRDNPGINQKTIAENLGIHATILGRILTTLENNGYIKRTRGREHGEWLVSLC